MRARTCNWRAQTHAHIHARRGQHQESSGRPGRPPPPLGALYDIDHEPWPNGNLHAESREQPPGRRGGLRPVHHDHLILHLGQCANRLGRWLDSIAPCYSFIGGHLDEMACVHHGYSVPMRCHYLDRVFFSLSVSTRSIAIDIYPLGERRSHLLMNPDDQNVSQSNPISHMADDWTPVYDGHDKSLRLIVVVHFV